MQINKKTILLMFSALFFVTLCLSMKKAGREKLEVMKDMLDEENDLSHTRLRFDGVYSRSNITGSNKESSRDLNEIKTLCFYKNGIVRRSDVLFDHKDAFLYYKIQNKLLLSESGAFEIHNDTITIVAYAWIHGKGLGNRAELAYYRAILKGDTIEWRMMPPYVKRSKRYFTDTATALYLFIPSVSKTFVDSVEEKRLLYNTHPRIHMSVSW